MKGDVVSAYLIYVILGIYLDNLDVQTQHTDAASLIKEISGKDVSVTDPTRYINDPILGYQPYE
jgi:hypothetical protein